MKKRLILTITLIILTCKVLIAQNLDIEELNKKMSMLDSEGRFGSLSNYFVNIVYDGDAEGIKNILPNKEYLIDEIKKAIPELKNGSYLSTNGCSLIFHYNITADKEYNNGYYGNIYLECLRIARIVDTQYETAASIFWGISSFISFNNFPYNMQNLIENNVKGLIKDFAINYYKGNN